MIRTTMIAAVLAGGVTAPGIAQGWIEPVRPPVHGSGVVKLRTDVTVQVSGRIAQVEVEELFRNDGGRLGEGDYLYPLPAGAVFSNFSLFQGDQELRGETMDANRARAIYEEIVRRKRDPALIELVGSGMIRARVFPIASGETRKITLRYTQLMARAGDALEFRYVAGGPRVGPVPVASEVQREFAPRPVPMSFELTASSDAFRDPFSPTHALAITRTGGRLRVRPEGPMHGRLAMFLPLAGTSVGLTVATHRPPGREDGYFMLTVSPPPATTETVARDVTVILDVSGSMSGRKLSQAKAALHQLLASLGDEDRFRLVAFSGRVRPFRNDWAPASGASLSSAREWIDALRADGGTNISGALEEAFAVPPGRERLPIVLFLTDGLPSAGEQDPDAIAAMASSSRGTARVFAFGVGFDVNTVLLDRLTAESQGSTQYVEPGEDVEHALAILAAKIQYPVLTDLTISAAPAGFDEIYPVSLPDLFAGEELVVFGRYAAAGNDRTGAIEVSGTRQGATHRFASDVTFPAVNDGNDFIPRLWASRKLGHLTRTIRLEGRTEALVQEIRSTALRYGLLSEYTSYLVLEPGAVVAPGADGLLGRPGQQRAGGVTGQPAPVVAESTGRIAVRAAEDARRQREVRSELELDELHQVMASRGASGTRRVAGREFTLDRGIWTDLLHRPGARIIKIAPFSPALFGLLRHAPELEALVTEFDSVLIAGRDVSIEFGSEGVETLDEQEILRLVRSFRGSY